MIPSLDALRARSAERRAKSKTHKFAKKHHSYSGSSASTSSSDSSHKEGSSTSDASSDDKSAHHRTHKKGKNKHRTLKPIRFI